MERLRHEVEMAALRLQLADAALERRHPTPLPGASDAAWAAWDASRVCLEPLRLELRAAERALLAAFGLSETTHRAVAWCMQRGRAA